MHSPSLYNTGVNSFSYKIADSKYFRHCGAISKHIFALGGRHTFGLGISVGNSLKEKSNLLEGGTLGIQRSRMGVAKRTGPHRQFLFAPWHSDTLLLESQSVSPWAVDQKWSYRVFNSWNRNLAGARTAQGVGEHPNLGTPCLPGVLRTDKNKKQAIHGLWAIFADFWCSRRDLNVTPVWVGGWPLRMPSPTIS